MNRTEQIVQNVERHRELIFAVHDYIWANPETGYREWKTTAYLEGIFESLGYKLTKAGNIPGFYTDIDTGRSGPKVLVMGEMDSLIIAEHPEAVKDTHYVHACGHHVQCAALVGAAAALKEPGALDGLSGSIRLMAVPAEELIEVDYRESLREQGIIRYYGGKMEFMHRGFMDDVDMAFMVHIANSAQTFSITAGCNGCLIKNIEFMGKSSHAGGSPHMGVNALYAANTALAAINALRETFRDEDHIRVHPVITKGGDVVNAIPASVTMESYVRGAAMEAITDVNRKVNRALAGAAVAMGANVELRDRPGYHPVHHNTVLRDLFFKAASLIKPEEGCPSEGGWDTICSDIGDVASVIPTIHPYCSGAASGLHTSDFCIADKETACIANAKVQVQLLTLLLVNGAKEAKAVLADKQTLYPSMEAYFEAVDKIFLNRTAVKTNKDGTLTLDFGA